MAGEIEHVVIDNLQFLVGLAILNDETANSFERFHQQVIIRFIVLIKIVLCLNVPVIHQTVSDSI